MKVYIDRDVCMNCIMCVEICPEVFAASEAGDRIEVKTERVPQEMAEKVNLAKQECPVDAIDLEVE